VLGASRRLALDEELLYHSNVLTHYYIGTSSIGNEMKHHDQAQQQDLRAAARTLSEALLSLETTREVREFLEDLCTPAELEAMVDRWRVAQLLNRGYTYRDIRSLTEVSVTTIGRVARFIERGSGGYRTALDRLENKTP
jgi:TrpR-related protein YerC/YecD